MWTDGRRWTPEHGYTISSPCEPEGSGELKILRTCVGVLYVSFTENLKYLFE